MGRFKTPEQMKAHAEAQARYYKKKTKDKVFMANKKVSDNIYNHDKREKVSQMPKPKADHHRALKNEGQKRRNKEKKDGQAKAAATALPGAAPIDVLPAAPPLPTLAGEAPIDVVPAEPLIATLPDEAPLQKHGRRSAGETPPVQELPVKRRRVPASAAGSASAAARDAEDTTAPPAPTSGKPPRIRMSEQAVHTRARRKVQAAQASMEASL